MDVPNEEVGLGVDIVEIARMRKIIERSPAFVEKVYSAAERAYCDSHAHPEVHYATRFAAKEAVLKALGTGLSEGIGWLDVEVRRTSKDVYKRQTSRCPWRSWARCCPAISRSRNRSCAAW